MAKTGDTPRCGPVRDEYVQQPCPEVGGQAQEDYGGNQDCDV
jgi:hypothetical protein